MVKNGLYHVEHEATDVVAAVDAEVVTIEKLHRLMGHISPDAVKVLVKKGIVDGIMNTLHFISLSLFLCFKPIGLHHYSFPFHSVILRLPYASPFALQLLYLDMTYYDSFYESYLFLDLRTSDDSFYESSLYLAYDSYGL